MTVITLAEVKAAEPRNFTQRHFARFAKALSVCALIGTLEDLARPIAPFAMYALLAALVVWMLSFPLARLISSMSEEVGVVRMAAGLIAVISVFLVAYEAINPTAAKRGLLASKIPAAAELQKTLVGIDRHLGSIEVNTRRTVDEIRDLRASAKQETSLDPRKELANLGVEWGRQSFNEALLNRDVRTMKLLLEGGMRPIDGRVGFRDFVDRYSDEIGELFLAYRVFDSADVCSVSDVHYIFHQVAGRSEEGSILQARMWQPGLS